jgi:hypothetical protein
MKSNPPSAKAAWGKVWRAHHTALKRDDALKVLPDAFAADQTGSLGSSVKMQRFRRSEVRIGW